MRGIAGAFMYNSIRETYKGDRGKFYDVPSPKDFQKGNMPKLKEGYISSSVPLHSGYGRAEYSQRPTGDRYGRTGKDSYGYIKGSGRPGFYIYKDPNFQKAAPKKKAAPKPKPKPKPTPVKPSKASVKFRKESQALLDKARAERKKFATDQANAAKAAAAQRRRDEAARVERERIATLTAAARSGNERIAGRSANLQIQPASTTPQTAGTQPFKRRKLQFNTPNYGGVGSIMSGILNI